MHKAAVAATKAKLLAPFKYDRLAVLEVAVLPAHRLPPRRASAAEMEAEPELLREGCAS